MPLDGSSRDGFTCLGDALDQSPPLCRRHLSELARGTLICHQWVTLSDWGRLDQPVSVLLRPPPLLLAILLKTRVFPLIQPHIPNFRQRQSNLDEGLLPPSDRLFQFCKPLRLPDARHHFMILHINSISSPEFSVQKVTT